MDPLRICLKPSQLFSLIMVFFTTGSLACIWSTSLPWSLQVLASLAVLVYSLRIFWNEVLLRHPQAWIEVQAYEAPLWQVQDRAGLRQTARLSGDSTLMGFLCILRLTPAFGGMRSVLVFRHMVEATTYSRLLMMLRTLKVE